MKINRVWAMPNKNTFTIKPIAQLIERYIEPLGIGWVDPFANDCRIAEITNDLNPAYKTKFNLDALEFLKIQTECNGVLYDPPYSITQAKECYDSYGKDKLKINVANMKYWAECKNNIARIIKPAGIVICCGWNTNGLGINRGFEMIEILIVAHGGSKNDTLVTVEHKSPL